MDFRDKFIEDDFEFDGYDGRMALPAENKTQIAKRRIKMSISNLVRKLNRGTAFMMVAAMLMAVAPTQFGEMFFTKVSAATAEELALAFSVYYSTSTSNSSYVHGNLVLVLAKQADI